MKKTKALSLLLSLLLLLSSLTLPLLAAEGDGVNGVQLPMKPASPEASRRPF